MRTPAQRGRIGNWLRDQRMARGWTQVETVKNLTTAGIPTPQSVYSEWESGTRVPNDRNLARLEAFFGPIAEKPEDATPSGFSDLLALQAQLVAAFEVQAQAVMALVDEMRLSRAGEVEDLLARVRAVESTVRLLHPELDTPASEARAAPQGSGGSAGAKAP